ncbi:MAG: class A sortase [Streptococcaceae bacterium]|jgi:sortase A|nr:class A sortase [Streptococcaceae bacterium]
MKRKLINSLLILVAFLGIALLAERPIRNWLMQHMTANYRLAQVSQADIARNSESDGNFDFDLIQPPTFRNAVMNQLNREQMPVIGGVAIPSIGINLPMFRGFGPNGLALYYGAGTMKTDQRLGEGNFALASHNVLGQADALFTPLERATVGMMIYVTEKQDIYEYKIREIQKVAPHEGHVIRDIEGKQLITLVTCFDGDRQRIIVRGEFIQKRAFTEATPRLLEAFALPYNEMQ